MKLEWPETVRFSAITMLVVLALGGHHAAAATLTVCPAGCDATTIQGALIMAEPGDTIEILASVHTEFDIFATKDVTITGFGAGTTIVQAHPDPGVATTPVFVVAGDAQVTIQSLSIRNGGGDVGGGVHVVDGNLVLSGVDVEENDVTDCGGGVRVEAGSSASITDGSLIIHNSAWGGGGLCNLGTTVITDSFIFNNFALGDLGVPNVGGGIYNGNALVLSDAWVSHNHVTGYSRDGLGGGIYQVGGSLEDVGSSIQDNTVSGAHARGGGLYVGGLSDSVALNGTTISGNEAEDGGGVFFTHGVIEMNDCSISSNLAAELGGGVALDHVSPSQATIIHSTLADNEASYGGGALVMGPGTLWVVNSTITGNLATDHGGGLYAPTTNGVEIASVTITDNTADSDGDGNGNGGGIAVEPGGSVGLRNTIVANNHDGSTFPVPVVPDCSGTIQSAGFNLIRSLGVVITGCTIEGDTTGNILGMDPLLLPLALNGGPTHTHELDSGSPAIDAGNFAGCTDPGGLSLDTDQRHAIRRNRCDIGAYETSGILDPLFWDGFESGDLSSWSAHTR